jgi:hypothetical protein
VPAGTIVPRRGDVATLSRPLGGIDHIDKLAALFRRDLSGWAGGSSK